MRTWTGLDSTCISIVNAFNTYVHFSPNSEYVRLLESLAIITQASSGVMEFCPDP